MADQEAKPGETEPELQGPITNLCRELLDHVFDFSDVESLLSMAGTCKRFQDTVVDYYGTVYGQYTVAVSGHRLMVFRGNDQPIVVERLGVCLPFLRCFGAKIQRLQVGYIGFANCAVDNESIDNVRPYYGYINEYCNALENISFSRLFPVEYLPYSFKRVEEVSIAQIHLNTLQLLHAVTLFPKVCMLILTDVYITVNCAGVSFPNLKKLVIKFKRDPAIRDFEEMEDSFGSLLCSNQQLQEVIIEADEFTIIIMRLANIVSRNPSLTKLRLVCGIDEFVDLKNLMQFVANFRNVMELDVPNWRITPQDAINFFRQVGSLKMFRFFIMCKAEYDQLVNQLDDELEWEWECRLELGTDKYLFTLHREEKNIEP